MSMLVDIGLAPSMTILPSLPVYTALGFTGEPPIDIRCMLDMDDPDSVEYAKRVHPMYKTNMKRNLYVFGNLPGSVYLSALCMNRYWPAIFPENAPVQNSMEAYVFMCLFLNVYAQHCWGKHFLRRLGARKVRNIFHGIHLDEDPRYLSAHEAYTYVVSHFRKLRGIHSEG